MYQPWFFQGLVFVAFFPLAGGPPGPLLFGDIFAVPNGVLLAGKSADKHHNNRPAPANSFGRYKKSWYTACMKQPSVKWFPFFRTWTKTEAVIIWRWLLGFRIYGMSVERLEVAASGLSLVMGTFPVFIGQKQEEKEENSKKKDEEETKNKNYKKRKEKQTEKKYTT